MNWHFTKEIKMANIYMKRHSTFATTRDMQIETITSYHSHPQVSPKLKKIKNNQIPEG